jgi:hypothetical protein
MATVYFFNHRAHGVHRETRVILDVFQYDFIKNLCGLSVFCGKKYNRQLQNNEVMRFVFSDLLLLRLF